jgi:hypothetical protein
MKGGHHSAATVISVASSGNAPTAVDMDTKERQAPPVFPNLRPSTKTISIRLPESLIEHLKVLANKRDVPYQTLLKMFLAEKVREEMGLKRSA